MILHLIRHSEPDIEPGICYGRLDIPAKNVRETAERLRTELPPGLPVWSSPLRRCRELAEMLHPVPIFDDRLMEMDFGAWEGKRWNEIPRTEIDAWAEDVMGYRGHGGESALALQRRVGSWLAEIRQGADMARELLIIAHAGVMRALHGLTGEFSGDAWVSLGFAYGACMRLETNR